MSRRSSGSAIAVERLPTTRHRRAIGSLVPGHLGRSRDRLPRGGEIPVAQLVLLADGEAAVGVVERRFGPTQHRVHASALPLAARAIGGCPTSPQW